MTAPYPINAALLESLSAKASDTLGERAATMFSEAMHRTVNDAVIRSTDGSAFVLTGDIPAMWLRDSAAQMRPYVAIAHLDEGIADLIAAIVRRQSAQVVADPYANAFNLSTVDAPAIAVSPDGVRHAVSDHVFEVDEE